MVTIRKDLLVNGNVYHVFNKSIANYTIFNTEEEYRHFTESFCYANSLDSKLPFSRITIRKVQLGEKVKTLVDIIAYCLMPTHYHFVLKQNIDGGIVKFISKISNSYAKYFNAKHKRNGPLWQGRFKNKLIEQDEELLHLTRYVHLNPVTAYLVDKPQDWNFSSCREYFRDVKNRICRYEEFLDINCAQYKKFVEDRIRYQKELAKIKHLIFE